MRQIGVVPQLVARRDMLPDRHRAIEKYQSDDSLPIDGRGDRLPETHIAEPLLLARNLGRLHISILIQDEEVVFQARAGVVHGEALTLLLAEQREIFRIDAADDVRLTILKAQYLR